MAEKSKSLRLRKLQKEQGGKYWRINMEVKQKDKIDEMDWIIANIRESLEKIREAREQELED